MNRPKRGKPKPVLLLLAALVILILGLRSWQILASRPSTIRLPAPNSATETPFLDAPQLTADPIIGHRPRADYAARIMVAAVGEKVATEAERRQERFGLISSEPIPIELTAPRVLLVGDLNLMGVVANADNLSEQLQTRLRETPELSHSVVLNAGCEGYSLYQSACRAASLVDILQPQVLVAFISMGDDFLELEDHRRPHVDDILLAQPPSSRKIPDASSNRRSKLGLPDTGIFWRGMNQASWMSMNAARMPILEAKTKHCLAMLSAAARRQRAGLLVVLIPPSDMLFPQLVLADGSAYAAEIVAAEIQLAWYQRIRKMLADEGIAFEDLAPAFSQYGQSDLYSDSYQLGVIGHRLAAESLTDRIAQLLTSRSRTH